MKKLISLILVIALCACLAMPAAAKVNGLTSPTQPTTASSSASSIPGVNVLVTIPTNYGSVTVQSFEPDTPLAGGTEFTVTMDVEMGGGCHVYTWVLQYCNSMGSWDQLASLSLPAGEGYGSWDIRVPSGKTVYALAITPLNSGSYSWQSDIEYTVAGGGSTTTATTASSGTELEGQWISATIGGYSTGAYELFTPLKGAKKIQLDFSVEMAAGAHISIWKVMYRDFSGSWVELTQLALKANETEASWVFKIPSGKTVYALAIVPNRLANITYQFDAVYTLK